MKKLWRLFTLKPYDDKLVDGVVDIWLLFVRLNIVSIALCDAIAWSYWAHITSSGTAGYLTAAVAGVIVFVLVASVDASFVMHDTTAQRRPVTMPGRSSLSRAVRWTRENIRRGHVAVLVRIALVVISFAVTAPFLAQFFFSRDITAAIERSNAANQATKRASIAANYDRSLANTREKLEARNRDLEAEVAGAGSSRRYGDGPTASAIKSDIAQYEAQIRNTQAAKTAELNAFSKATPEVLASRYGIDVKREGPDTRARIVAEMEKSPAFRAMRNNIKWFLGFMFLALMTLKFFQGEAVKHYFSADLQAAYHRYEIGIYNAQLDAREHADQGGMTPGQFARWYNDHQRELEESDRLRQKVTLAQVRNEAQSQGFESLATVFSSDLTKMRADLDAALKQKDGLDQPLADAKSKLAMLHTKIEKHEKELHGFRYENDNTEDLSLSDGEFLVRRKQLIERQLTANRAAAVETESVINRVTQQIEDNRVYREQIAAAIEDCGRQVAELAALVNEARRRNMEDIASAV